LVISRNSTFTYKGKDKKIPEIAKELNVRYILEGSVRRAGDQVRINAQLIDAEKDHHIWAERFDDTLQNIFELQDKITKKIVSALAVKLSIAEESNVSAKETTNEIAYDAFLKGREHFNKMTPDDFVKAVDYFERTIKIDPNYSRAYAALGQTYNTAWLLHFPAFWEQMKIDGSTGRLRAVHYLKLAMRNPTLEAYILAAGIGMHRRHYDEMIAYAEKALAIAPNTADGNRWLGTNLVFAGKPEKAIGFLKKALRLDPYNLQNITRVTIFIGLVHFSLGDLEKAVEFIEKGLKINPEFKNFSNFLAASYAHLGQNNEAKKALENYLTLYPKGYHPSIKQLYFHWPFKNVEVFNRLAEGLVKAGLRGNPSDYYKVVEENKLTGKKIRETIWGHKLTGFNYWGAEYWVKYDDEGNINYYATWIEKEKKKEVDVDGNETWIVEEIKKEIGDKGKAWIEGSMNCIQWDNFFGGLTNCSEYYRNPDGNVDTKSEYIGLSYTLPFLFSVID
jgi:tetratricopeptide (TPR) repeat protein